MRRKRGIWIMDVEKEIDVEKELEKMLTEGELRKEDEQKEAVKRLPPKWVALSPSSYNQVEEETKLLRKYVKEEE